MEKPKLNPDEFKPWQDICSPDVRSGYKGGLIDPPKDFSAAIAVHHAKFDVLELRSSVPEAIQIQFATAKNLCLYAWFVYRFYPVAEHQALTCLEFALRSRFAYPLPKEYWNKPRQEPTLQPLLRYAIDSGVLQNHGFRRWHEMARLRARQRVEIEQLRDISDRGLSELWFDPDEVVPNDQDYEWNLLSVLKECLHKTRNAHAHGTTMLHMQSFGTLELVSEIINQLFPEVANAV